ncbi:gas vesicle structural protein GvpA [Streptomyces specialis]|uniref:gas vesicle structural protein GvpA n=1 Tax=Streptomyces specialis TaxID=498367 RepID=UPI00073E20C5|nr:gas vesicle structural protein GvpA [Streptomyces specialis]
MTTAVAPLQQSSGSRSGTLYDVLELILDRGLVIDAFVRVSLVGIEILKIDVRVVVASVDTYLRFAEACNRLDLEAGPAKDPGVPELVGGLTENGARGKTKGALAGAAETISDAFKKGRDGLTSSSSGDDDEAEKEPTKSRRTTTSRRERESE